MFKKSNDSKKTSPNDAVKISFWGGISIDPGDALARANVLKDIESIRKEFGSNAIQNIEITECNINKSPNL